MTVKRLLALPIRAQLPLLATLVALPAAAIIVFSGLRVRDEAVSRAHAEAQRLVDAIAAEQQNLLAGGQQLVTVIAHLPQVRAKDRGISEILRELLKLNPQYSNLFIADREGNVWASGVPPGGFNVRDRRYFRNAVERGQLSSGEYVISRATSRPTFNIAYPLRDEEGAIVGAACMGIALDSVRRQLAAAALPEGTSYLLIDHRGVILSRGIDPDRYLGTPYPAELFEEMKLGPESRTYQGKGLLGDERIISYRKLRIPGEAQPYMYVRAGIPAVAALAAAERALARDVGLFLSGLVLAIAFAAMVGKRSIADRVAALETASRRLAAGDLDSRVSDVVRGGELGRLGETFDTMAARLSAREKALLESERNTREIFDATSDGILVADAATGKIREANRSAQMLYGRSREELLATTIDELCGAAPTRTRRPMIVGEGPLSFEWPAHRKDGSTFHAEITLEPTPIGGEGRVLLVVRDVSERRRAEEENDRLQAQLVQAQKMESVGRLAGGVAHDFNNMLSVILGEAELIQAALPPEHACRESAAEIARAALRSRDVTRQLLAFSRKQVAVPRPVDLNVLAAAMHQTLARLIGEDVALVVRPAPALWPVRLDPAQLDQILVNLVVNARDAMPGGGRVVIETANVHVGDEGTPEVAGIPPGDYAMLVVQDCGTGMDDETLAHLFEPFYTTKGSGKGTGLGLATVYGIVTQNGGHVRVRSVCGEGTTFRIYLPRTDAAVAGPPELLRAATAAGAGTVLLVEDEDLVRATARMMLESLGYEVTAVASPLEALALCEREDARIDLLLTDVVMPEMKGTDHDSRASALRPGLPTVFMSGYTSDATIEPVTATGAGFLQKPFSAHDLARAVGKALA